MKFGWKSGEGTQKQIRKEWSVKSKPSVYMYELLKKNCTKKKVSSGK